MIEAESRPALSPMLREYKQTQAEYPGAVVLWRNGEFYEVYFETAELIGSELNMRVKPRPFGREAVPFTGMPLANLRDAVQRLLQRGYRVVVVEQVDDPEPTKSAGKKSIMRSVARVFTPGTLVELDLLDQHSNNYLAAVINDEASFGLAYCDISTGEFVATEFRGAHAQLHLEGELMRLQPAEILISDHLSAQASKLMAMQVFKQWSTELETKPQWSRSNVTALPAWQWSGSSAADVLMQHFNTVAVAGFGLGDTPLALRAAGAVIQYLQQTHQAKQIQLDQIRTVRVDEAMFLDPQTQRNLELLAPMGSRKRGALVDLLDETLTPMGSRLLRRWVTQPLTQLAPLERRQAAISSYVQATLIRASLRETLKGVSDIERLTNRILQGVAGVEDLRRLQDSLRILPEIAPLCQDPCVLAQLDPERNALDAEHRLDLCTDALALLDCAIQAETDEPDELAKLSNSRRICQGFDPELDRIVAAMQQQLAWISAYEAREIERTGIKTLKVSYSSKTKWFIHGPKLPQAALLPSDYRLKGGSTDERYTTPALIECETALENNLVQLRELDRAAFARVIAQLAGFGRRLLGVAHVVAQLDVCVALAEVAVKRRYVRPVLSENTTLEIVNGRHPIVEASTHDSFVPNDTHMNTNNAQILVITGPNMVGKSTYLRQVALITLLAQIGSYVPADAARIGLADRIFTRIGAQDDIAMGQSTFMVEMIETANILHTATQRSLIVFDELGRGTSTYDGISIAQGVLEWLHESPRLGCRTLFATHYYELTELAKRLGRICNYHVTVKEEQNHIIFLRKVLPGKADRSYGIHVAAMAGMPQPVMQRAKAALATLEALSRELSTQPTLWQLPLAAARVDAEPAQQHAALQQLRTLALDELSPLAALTKLYELQKLSLD